MSINVMLSKKIAVIILAAGKGERFGGRKQFVEIEGKPIWKHVYDKCRKIFGEKDIVVVGIDVMGGESRSESVRKGIYELEKRGTYERILVMEAARPLITQEQIIQIAEDNHDSCTYIIPCRNTVIKKDITYLNRDELYELSSPQAFNWELFRKAYIQNNFDSTDDTKIMYEKYGIKPFFLRGGENMLKLTYLDDILLLEGLMKKYSL